jgi:hypothetical protein
MGTFHLFSINGYFIGCSITHDTAYLKRAPSRPLWAHNQDCVLVVAVTEVGCPSSLSSSPPFQLSVLTYRPFSPEVPAQAPARIGSVIFTRFFL